MNDNNIASRVGNGSGGCAYGRKLSGADVCALSPPVALHHVMSRPGGGRFASAHKKLRITGVCEQVARKIEGREQKENMHIVNGDINKHVQWVKDGQWRPVALLGQRKWFASRCEVQAVAAPPLARGTALCWDKGAGQGLQQVNAVRGCGTLPHGGRPAKDNGERIVIGLHLHFDTLRAVLQGKMGV
jgi:hypothetical protein